MNKFTFTLVIAIIAVLQGCMSTSRTFNKPEKGFESSFSEKEPNGCNKIFIGTRTNIYLLKEHPHAYQIAYYDFVPSILADIILIPISLPYTTYVYTANKCNSSN